jgi:hypothetical protein
MDKETVIGQIKTLIQEGRLTKNELMAIYESSLPQQQDHFEQQANISNILYYIGGAIIFVGIGVFVATNWSRLSDLTRILATLGSSIILYLSAALLSRNEKAGKVADAFYFVSGLVAPMGIFITMDIAGIDTGTAGIHTAVAGTLLLINLLSYHIDRRNVFIVFSIITGTWFFFSLTTFLVGGRPFSSWDYIKYRWLIAGITHLCLGNYFAGTEKKHFTRWLYAVGSIEFFTAAFFLGGWTPNQNVLWELLFPGLTFGALFLSVYTKSRSFLICGSFYLMVYIIKITMEYFKTGFGWSLSLIMLGFALIGIGYLAFYLNKKYITAA